MTRNPEQNGGNWLSSWVHRGREARYDPKAQAPKPFHAIVADAKTPISEAIMRQKARIEAMLASDPTGSGRVIVVVDNPLLRNRYQQTVINETATGKSLTDAEDEAFRSEGHDADAKKITKSELSQQTTKLIDALMEAHPGRIRVQTYAVPEDTEKAMGEKGLISSSRLTDEIQYLAPGRNLEEYVDAQHDVYAAKGSYLRDRAIVTAGNVATALADDRVLGGVAIIGLDGLGFSDQLEGSKDAKGKARVVVQREFLLDMVHHDPPESEEALLLKAEEGTMTIFDIVQAMDDRRARNHEKGEVNYAVYNVINASNELYDEMKTRDAFVTKTIEHFFAERGEFEPPEGEDIHHEPSAQERMDALYARARQYAPNIANAYLEKLGRKANEGQWEHLTGEITERIIVNQSHWEAEINRAAELHLMRSASLSDLAADSIESARSFGVESIGGLIGRLTEASETVPTESIGIMMTMAEYIDPHGLVKRIDIETIYMKDVNFGSLLTNYLNAQVLQSTADIPQGERTRHDQDRAALQDEVAKILTRNMLEKKGYSDLSEDTIAKHKGDIQKHVTQLQWHYEQEIARLNSSYSDLFKAPTDEQKVAVWAYAEKAVLDSVKELIGSDNVTTATIGVSMFDATIKDPDGIQQRREVHDMRAEQDIAKPSVSHALLGRTQDLATGFGIPSKDEYDEAVLWEEEAVPVEEFTFGFDEVDTNDNETMRDDVSDFGLEQTDQEGYQNRRRGTDEIN